MGSFARVVTFLDHKHIETRVTQQLPELMAATRRLSDAIPRSRHPSPRVRTGKLRM